jgi:FAD:protein FMN transferase
VPQAWRQVGIDPAGAVMVPLGVALDLGSTGKAYAADLVAAQVADQVGTGLIISVGGDVAIGIVGRPAELVDWPISVGELPDAQAQETVMLQRGGLATSGTMNRRWKRGGQVVHHLLDPRTGRPVRASWRTVTVAGPSCVAANTASTASIVMAGDAPDWLAERGLPARLVSTDGEVVRVAGWPEGDE